MSGLNYDTIGYQVTKDTVVGDSGKPIALFSWTMKASVDADGTVIFRNGTLSTDTEVFEDTVTMGTAKTNGFDGKGVVFPKGLFVSADAGIDTLTIEYRQIRT